MPVADLAERKNAFGRHVAVLAQHGVDQVTVPVDRPIQVAPASPDLQVGLVNVPGATAGAALPAPALPQFIRQRRCEPGFPVADRLVAEHDATKEEHLGQVAQGQAVAQALEHHQRDHVARVLRPVQFPRAALVEPSAAGVAPEASVAVGRTVPPLSHIGRTAPHATHLRLPTTHHPVRSLSTPPPPRQSGHPWRES